MTRPASFARYAVYWVPEEGSALAAFGVHWLGHDPASDAPAPIERTRLGLPEDFVERVTAEPRRYGLHATLKAPFRLAPRATPQALVARTAQLARALAPVDTRPLRLTDLSGFLALCPMPASTAINALAVACVEHLDDLRAPLTPQEHARRKPQFLSARQLALLDRWGYPHVMEAFRFHITLTARLAGDDRARLRDALEPAVAPFCVAPFALRSIALVGDPGDGRPFRLVQRFALGTGGAGGVADASTVAT